MALAFTTVATAISNLSVSGVTIKDIDEIPDSVPGRDTPIMFPEPDRYISEFTYTRDSFGGAGTSLATVTYNLTYAFLYCPVGTDRGLHGVYDDMVAKVGLILDAVISNDDLSTSTVDFVPLSPFEFGAVPDPAGNMFIGTRLVFQVKEFVN